MKILALDTSSKFCSIALNLNKKIYVDCEQAPRQQNQRLLPMIQKLLQQHNIQLSELDAIACGCGPGSFTGIRLAVSVTQGLAFAANLPVIPVSDLQALAQSALRKFNVSHAAVAINAYGGYIYWGLYRSDELGMMSSVVADQKSRPEEVVLFPEGEWRGIGDGWEFLSHLPVAVIYPDCFPEAQDIAHIACNMFLQGKQLSPEKALPVYLHDAASWKGV